MDKYQEEFINNLKFYRKEKGISQEKLAELCEVSTSTISCVESFHQNPSFELLLKIAEALNIHPADLFLRDASKVQGLNFYSKYRKLIQNCEYISESHQSAVCQLAQSLADATPKYTTSN